MFSPDDMRFLDLLQKWQDGSFTRSDEQELLALTRGDDFRREAWEGLQLHPEVDHSTRLAVLRAKLHPEKTVRRVTLPQMAALAAAFVVLLGAIWFFRGPDPDPYQDGAIARNDVPTIQNESMSDAAPPREAAPAAPEDLKAGAASKSVQPAPSGVAAMRREMESQSKTEDVSMVASEATSPAVTPEVSSSPKEEKIAEEYTNSDVALEESAGNQKEQKADADDFAKSSAKKKSEMAPKPAAPAPATRSKDARGNANAVQNVDFELVALQDYLRSNARLPEAAKQNNVSGFVRVSFRLRKNDKPAGFKIIRSLGYGCDEEAIRLLQVYPNWRDFTQDELTVEVPFVR